MARDTGVETFFGCRRPRRRRASAAATAAVTLLSATLTGGGAIVIGPRLRPARSGDDHTLQEDRLRRRGSFERRLGLGDHPGRGKRLLHRVRRRRDRSSDRERRRGRCVELHPDRVDNTSWPKAAPLSDGTTATSRPASPAGTVRRPARTPGHGHALDLPADYDLAFFKDIAQAYTRSDLDAGADELSAEFAGDAYSPSAFSPSQFSPGFSPSRSARAFSPDAFIPSRSAPRVQPLASSSPSRSARAHSARRVHPVAVQPVACSARQSAVQPRAFSSAQTRSLVASPPSRARRRERRRNTWTNTGDFYVRVSGRNGAFVRYAAFHLQPRSPAARARRRADRLRARRGRRRRLQDGDPHRLGADARHGAEKADLQAKLKTSPPAPRSAARSSTSPPTAASALNAQADANKSARTRRTSSPARSRTSSTRTARTTRLRYVVIVGADNVVPFFRYPDATLIGNEKGYVPPVATRAPRRRACASATSSARTATARRPTSRQGQHLPCRTWRSGASSRPRRRSAACSSAYLARRGVCRRRPPRSSPATTSSPTPRNAVKTELAAGHRHDARHADHRRPTSRRSTAVVDGGAAEARSCSAAATT